MVGPNPLRCNDFIMRASRLGHADPRSSYFFRVRIQNPGWKVIFKRLCSKHKRKTRGRCIYYAKYIKRRMQRKKCICLYVIAIKNANKYFRRKFAIHDAQILTNHGNNNHKAGDTGNHVSPLQGDSSVCRWGRKRGNRKVNLKRIMDTWIKGEWVRWRRTSEKYELKKERKGKRGN